MVSKAEFLDKIKAHNYSFPKSFFKGLLNDIQANPQRSQSPLKNKNIELLQSKSESLLPTDEKISFKKFKEVYKIFCNLPICKRSQSNNSDMFKQSQDQYVEHNDNIQDNIKPIFRLLHSKIEEHFKNYRNAFRKFDIDHDGKIDFGEFALGLDNIGISLNVSVVRAVFSQLDTDSNKTL